MNPLFYNEIVVISRENEGTRRVAHGGDKMQFCAKMHLCPALAAEFVAAAGELPIVFLKQDGGATPVFLLGLKPEHNLFVDKNGRWTGRYMPRYLDRYPFILVDLPDQVRALGMEASASNDKDGQLLFNEDGTQSNFVSSALAACESYARDALVSDTFVARLTELGLLRDITIQLSSGNETFGWTDLMIVDEAKLGAMTDEQVLVAFRSGDLAVIYAHLLSLRTLAQLKEQYDSENPVSAAPASTTPVVDATDKAQEQGKKKPRKGKA